jgi:hypothetical protein
VQTKGLPILDISLNFDAASSTDGEKYGLASLTNSLLAVPPDTTMKSKLLMHLNH